MGSERRHEFHYTLVHRGVEIFDGNDFSTPLSVCVDSDDVVRGLMGFLCLRPGDTDQEYFNDYTPDQHAFASEFAEYLGYYVQEEWRKRK